MSGSYARVGTPAGTHVGTRFGARGCARFGVRFGVRSVARALGAVVLVLAPRGAAGQDILSGGYYEHTFRVVASQRAHSAILDASKLRLDLSSGFGDAITFQGNVNLLAYHTGAAQDLRPFLPAATVDAFQAAGVPTTQALDGSRAWLDNAFLTWNAGEFRLRAGKQQLAWGPGYGYNPTDLFHRKDPIDPTYENEGVAAFRVDYRWGVGGQATVIGAPRNDPAESGYALRLGTHLSGIGYDVAITAHQVRDTTRLAAATLMPVRQRRRALGLELSGPLLGMGVWFEGNYNRMQHEDDFTRFIAGADYTLQDGTYLMAEVLFNGRADDAPYPAHAWLGSLLSGEPVNRWWVLNAVRRELSALTGAELYLFSSGDGSFALNPRLQLSVAQNAELVVFGGLTFGDDQGAFPPGLAMLVARATVFF